jgi:pterin-4a-carbinolamine dehydratase
MFRPDLSEGGMRMNQAATYSEAEATERLATALPKWWVEDGQLCRRYATEGWRASMLLANGIAHLAEVTWHHPDLHIAWGGVTVKLRTHSANAISDKDFELAQMIEGWVCWRPAAGSALEGAPAEGKWRYLAGE